MAADRLDGKVDILQPEAMRRDLLERKALRCELRQSQLASLVAVPAGALDGDGLHRDPSQGKVGKLRELALHDDRAGLALERFHTEKNRNGARAGGAVEDDVHALAAGDLLDARQRVFLVHVDRKVGAELLCYFQSFSVF